MLIDTAGNVYYDPPICSCGKQDTTGQCEHIVCRLIYKVPTLTPPAGEDKETR